jgi:hypothetical protein
MDQGGVQALGPDRAQITEERPDPVQTGLGLLGRKEQMIGCASAYGVGVPVGLD